MNASGTNALLDPSEPKTLVEGAYHQLRNNIINGIHRPGERLRVEHLKDQYDVGAGTLREALLLLISDALVVAQGQRGFRVAPMSLSDFEDITRSRLLIECTALEMSIENGRDDWEASVVTAFYHLSKAERSLGTPASPDAGGEWEQRNRMFHTALISACPSRWILHFQGILYKQSERYRRLSISHHPIARDVHTEHRILYESTIARDVARAKSALSEHILRTLDGIKTLPADFFEVSSAAPATAP
ncbi:FCD domain-containing protein [Castellaniella defragrans]|uniref:DNA-binding GntR family transcriptional regulator n=1 Tax=Castellaniella defragrans TaxID=75697 RepID=A0A7W9WQB0_CASDE|nr:FCD domain-containing protein [Castellaniella defragrans]MBB6085413.1 DNA-binding GntR family transcriptional regulator [Castellaniella defragrans]